MTIATLERRDLVVVAATAMEAKAARRELPGIEVCETGVALTRWQPENDTIISCGLAGGLRHEHPTGTVLIPREVARANGDVVRCDAELTAALAAAARTLGLEPLMDPLVTTPRIVRGSDRALWAERGYAAVDMETGLLHGARRLAAVRVILDTPLRELSEEWLDPVRAMLRPRNWPELLWLARNAPRYARLAARVIGRALA